MNMFIFGYLWGLLVLVSPLFLGFGFLGGGNIPKSLGRGRFSQAFCLIETLRLRCCFSSGKKGSFNLFKA